MNLKLKVIPLILCLKHHKKSHHHKTAFYYETVLHWKNEKKNVSLMVMKRKFHLGLF
jgi:hypothetical protein